MRGAGRGSRYTGNDTEDSAQSVIHAVDGITDPAASSAMPAFAFQDTADRGFRRVGLRTCDGREGLPVLLLVGQGLSHNLLGRRIVERLKLVLIPRDVAVLVRLHPADDGERATTLDHPVSHLLPEGWMWLRDLDTESLQAAHHFSACRSSASAISMRISRLRILS